VNSRARAALWAIALAAAIAAVAWHMASWHSNGMYLEMFRWTETGKGYLTALYNLGVMLLLGILLGVLMDRIGVIAGRGRDREKPPVE